MKSNKVKISALSLNENNPRVITDDAFERLKTSILVFPKMLTLRPIVIDGLGVALGGNMRLRALQSVSAMPIEEIEERLLACDEYIKLTCAERDALLSYWRAWLEEPTADVVSADDLSEDEMSAFVIKDNVNFGEWDLEALNQGWDARLLDEWNVEVGDIDAPFAGDAVLDEEEEHRSLCSRYIIPPFSVLDSRQNYWKERKEGWERVLNGSKNTPSCI